MDWRDRLQAALILGFEGNLDGSESALVELSREFPKAAEVRYELGMLQFMQGRCDEGCANIRAVLEIDPNHEGARTQIGYC